MQEIHRVCLTCGGEFDGRVNLCPECGLPLRWSTEVPSGRSGSGYSGLPSLEPSSDLVLVRAADLGWVRALAARLARMGIRSFMSIVADPSLTPEQLAGQSFHPNWEYFLFVRPEDLEASEEVDRALLAWIPTLQSCPNGEGGLRGA